MLLFTNTVHRFVNFKWISVLTERKWWTMAHLIGWIDWSLEKVRATHYLCCCMTHCHCPLDCKSSDVKHHYSVLWSLSLAHKNHILWNESITLTGGLSCQTVGSLYTRQSSQKLLALIPTTTNMLSASENEDDMEQMGWQISHSIPSIRPIWSGQHFWCNTDLKWGCNVCTSHEQINYEEITVIMSLADGYKTM